MKNPNGMLTSEQIRSRFLQFFQTRGHAIIPSASLVPENDPSVLFNTAGMQPLVPYLLGEKHPAGTRLVNSQKCVRTNDINEVGDNTHLTFFEMLGNWSLGDYWKKEAIEWSYEFLTSPDEGLGLSPQRLYITCFEGNDDAPRDMESANIWREIFEKNNVTGERIYFRPAEKNWWSAGDNGPCGPDTEMFYDLTGELNKGMTLDEYLKADDEQKVVEIWNDVFMEYLKKDGTVVRKLEKKNVDTGSGLERVVMVVQGKNNIFDTDVFQPIMTKIDQYSTVPNVHARRIVADHVRTAVFMIADGVTPSNTDRGYVLRRLLRRAIRYADVLSMKSGSLSWIAEAVIEKYVAIYPQVNTESEKIKKEIDSEESKFRNTLQSGLKKFEKLLHAHINGEDAFVLFSTYGFPFEVTAELAKEKGITIDEKGFAEEMKKHQARSRVGSEHKFKGGLGGTGDMEVKYHTATHLLHQALRDVLGNGVEQRGSNITSERLRFDFTYREKMSDEQKRQVENIVNGKITEKLPMQKVVMKKIDAENTGALHFFGDTYGNEVSVYYIGDSLESAYSKEFCGGPHVDNIGVLGHFKIIKEEAISAGVRRIKAVLE